jgi:peptidyl-prolyl cis-trans isomerase C
LRNFSSRCGKPLDAGLNEKQYTADTQRTNHLTQKGDAMSRATASHILVKTKKECDDLKQQIADGAEFAQIAKKHSTCPSGRDGGALGEFTPGQMVPEFDTVVFSEEVGQVHGPVKTQFGYHLILITSRED